jgi:hypothetical protein
VASEHIVAKAKTLKVGDDVSWNSEAGRVSGRIVRVHTKDLDYKGYTHHASKDDPPAQARRGDQTHGLRPRYLVLCPLHDINVPPTSKAASVSPATRLDLLR